MINRDDLIKYVRITSGCDADPNLTLVDFSLDDEQRSIVNLVNNEAKTDKNLANLLDSLKYSNKKIDVINEYFDNLEKMNVISQSNDLPEENNFNISNARFCGRQIDSYGFVSLSSLAIVVGTVTLILAIVISLFAK